MAVRLVERIMTQHGDIRCCRCWFCLAARDLGCQVRPEFVGAEPFAPLSTPVAR
jgi:hypothetical protein